MTKPLVLITEPIARDPEAWLGERCHVKEIGTQDPGFAQQLASAAGLIVRTYTRVDRDLLDRAPNLKVVGRAGVGLDNIDLTACAARGVRVVHTPHANAMAVVEYTISMLAQALRPIHPLSKPLSADAWHSVREDAITPRSLVGSTLGIVGFGHIGSRVARAASALGMPVLFNDLRSIDPNTTHGAAPLPLNELLARCNCLCVHVDGRAGNRGLIGSDAFSRMRPDAVLVNASRGLVVDPVAAVAFARANPRSTLILDVHDPEPIEMDSELYTLPNIVLTPHIAAATREAKIAMSWVVRDVWSVLNGLEPDHTANIV